MNKELLSFLAHKAYNMRVSSLRATTQAGSGHVTSSLSAADIMAALFFYGMHFDPQDPNNPNNDRFILSKGHAAPILYAVWKELGVVSDDELMQYRMIDSPLEGHPTPRFSRSEAATGSLGQGLSVGLGMALTARLDKKKFYVYVLLGDAESTEGSVWEAAEVAAYYKIDNLVAILDCNRLGQSIPALHEHNVMRYAEKFAAFGWQPLIVDGHNMVELTNVLDEARNIKDKPTIIIAKTFKGYGIEGAEDKEGFHGKAFKKEELPGLLDQLEERFVDDVKYAGEYQWHSNLPKQSERKSNKSATITIAQPPYKLDQEVPTRKAYGYALEALGGASQNVVSLDAEVKNSTFAEIFEHAYPERFFQSFVAEQNMVGMAVGMANRGKIPFVSTFGAFFTRAFDQIRMAAVGQAPLRLVGSHAGVSIGQDGPSQMALEDIAMMQTLPNSVVLYPSDAVSTHKLIELMANRNDGISYLRTTRMATPVLYKDDDSFSIGGCKVLHQSERDVACVIGAGITVFEALKAQKLLAKDGIQIAVIDLYSIKPLPTDTLLRVARKAGNRIITVEDHYLHGGIGQTVRAALCNENVTVDTLAVDALPRSGKPEELMRWAGIDAQAIAACVRSIG